MHINEALENKYIFNIDGNQLWVTSDERSNVNIDLWD